MSRSRKKNPQDDDCPRGCRCDDCRELEKTRVRKRLREISDELENLPGGPQYNFPVLVKK